MFVSKVFVEEGFFYVKFEFECWVCGVDILVYLFVVVGGNWLNILYYVKNN